MDFLSDQFGSFLLTMLTGAWWGIYYDFYRSVRGGAYGLRRRVDLGDLLFWFGSALLIMLGLIVSNWLEIRFFTLIALLTGYLIYKALGRPVVFPVFKTLCRLADWFLSPWVGMERRIGLSRRLNRHGLGRK